MLINLKTGISGTGENEEAVQTKDLELEEEGKRQIVMVLVNESICYSLHVDKLVFSYTCLHLNETFIPIVTECEKNEI